MHGLSSKKTNVKASVRDQGPGPWSRTPAPLAGGGGGACHCRVRGHWTNMGGLSLGGWTWWGQIW
jgi:hypothetical protein